MNRSKKMPPNFKDVLKKERSLKSFSCALSLLIFIFILANFSACTFPVRTGYDRKIGDYKPAVSSTQNTQEVASVESKNTDKKTATSSAAKSTPKQPHQNSAARARAAVNQKEIARAVPKKSSDLESFIKPWLGTRYKLGGTTKSGIDCSGYVMVIYKQFYGIAVDHNAASIYKDGRGKKVSRGDLKEGDLVFFGDFWGISHIGIYLKGDRFTHASTSKGVMISPMNDKYWSPKYKGAKRFR